MFLKSEAKKYVKLMMYVKSDFLMLVQQCVIIDVRPTLFRIGKVLSHQKFSFRLLIKTCVSIFYFVSYHHYGKLILCYL